MKVNRFGLGDRLALPAQILIDDEEERRGMPGGDMVLAKRALALLLKHYPGHPWSVRVTSYQGILTVRLLIRGYERFTSLFHYFIKLDLVHGDPNLKCVVRAGGELLERWGLARKGIDMAEYMKAKPQFNDITHRSLQRIDAPPPRLIVDG